MDDLWTQRSNTTSMLRLTDFAGPEPRDLVDMARRENRVRSRLRANSPIRQDLAGQHVDVRLTASVGIPIARSNWRFGESEKFMKYIIGMLFVLGALLVLVNGCATWAS
jgi:hypothetical protein